VVRDVDIAADNIYSLRGAAVRNAINWSNQIDVALHRFGGDRERFGLPSDVNAFLIENDVWQFSP
jgi:alkyl sulfatase BDS1-like metallo-beta-lactamase superfamily hydrolase